jgi:hypothetical protein
MRRLGTTTTASTSIATSVRLWLSETSILLVRPVLAVVYTTYEVLAHCY